MAGGATAIATAERLRTAREAGVLADADGRAAEEAFHLVSALRLEHQVEQIRAGAEPDNHIRPGALTSLTRSYLKDAFRAVTAVQRRISTDMLYGVTGAGGGATGGASACSCRSIPACTTAASAPRAAISETPTGRPLRAPSPAGSAATVKPVTFHGNVSRMCGSGV